jgi:hypothetical protein
MAHEEDRKMISKIVADNPQHEEKIARLKPMIEEVMVLAQKLGVGLTFVMDRAPLESHTSIPMVTSTLPSREWKAMFLEFTKLEPIYTTELGDKFSD